MGARRQTKGRGGRRQGKQTPRRVPVRHGLYVPQAVQCRGAGGFAPGEINFGAPLPRRGRGLGGWGQEGNLKAGVAGGKESKLPAGCRQRPPSRQGRGKPPAGTTAAGQSGNQSRQPLYHRHQHRHSHRRKAGAKRHNQKRAPEKRKHQRGSRSGNSGGKRSGRVQNRRKRHGTQHPVGNVGKQTPQKG